MVFMFWVLRGMFRRMFGTRRGTRRRFRALGRSSLLRLPALLCRSGLPRRLHFARRRRFTAG